MPVLYLGVPGFYSHILRYSYCLQAIIDVECFENGAHVGLDSGTGQIEIARDLFV